MGLIQYICSKIWVYAEENDICLGCLAPYIFGGMIGRKPRRVK